MLILAAVLVAFGVVAVYDDISLRRRHRRLCQSLPARILTIGRGTK